MPFKKNRWNLQEYDDFHVPDIQLGNMKIEETELEIVPEIKFGAKVVENRRN
jgi:hypothetical protein